MAESWRQKKVDIEHWLQGIQPPSPDPFLKASDNRELTSSSDISTIDQTTLSSPIVTPISSPPKNTQLSFSPRPQPAPVNEPLAFICIQSERTAPPPAMHNPIGKSSSYDSVSKGNSPESRYSRTKTQSPLPTATPEQKLPSFSTFDEDDDPSQDVDIKRINKMINRPPSNPMRHFGRASTSPILLHKDHNRVTRKESPPISLTIGKAFPRSNLAQNLTVATLSRKKSLSEQDISQLVEKERRTSKGGYSSDSEVKTKNPEPCDDDSSDLQSSTGACGLGSDPSSSERGGVRDKSAVLRQGRLANGMLSAESVDVIETRLRERRLGLGPTVGRSDDASTSPALLLSPTSPPTHLSRQSCLSRSPTPTPPTSPYHLSIVPITQHSGTQPCTKSTRVTGENEQGISKKLLKQFNVSQQFSFDTTNDERFNKPARHPKFLKSSFLAGTSLSRLGMATHHRSHSDMSFITPFKSQSNSQQGSIRHNTTNTNSADRRYKSQLDLSSSKLTSEVDGSIPLTLYEQIQLKKSQTDGREGRTSGSSKKTKVFRQDSGLGTLSTIS